MSPDAVADARFSIEEKSLWLEFGDGVQATVRWSDLDLGPDAKRLRPETAVVAEDGSSVQLLKRDDDIFDIDSSSLRAMVDATHARRLGAEAAGDARQVGSRLRARRNERGVTQSQLASRSGLEQALISKLEAGKHRPRLDTLERYALGLGLSVAELLG